MFKTQRILPCLVAAAGALALQFGCAVQFLSVNLENPSPRVGESTTLRLEVLAGWFRNPTFYYRALRGRIVGMNGEVGPQGGYTRATNQVRYYAPYTSSYQSPNGIANYDEITILAQDGTNITRTTKQVNIIGSSVVFATQPPQGQYNGTIMISTATGGQQETQPVALKDLAGRDIQGTSPAISPLGDKIAYVYYPGDGTSKIMMRDASGQVVALTNNSRGLDLDPAWSPDGAYLLFAGNHETTDGTYEIYLESVDQLEGGRAVTRLTNNNWDERHPSWNPTATTASLGLAQPAQPTDPGVTGYSTTSIPAYQTQQVAGPGMIALSARKNTLNSPGGRGQNWNLFLMDSRGNYIRELSDLQGDGDNWAVEPAWRLDGNAIAYTRYGPVNNFQSNSAKFQRIFVQELQQSLTQTPLNVSNTDPNAKESSPIWATDQNNALYFLRTNGSFQTYAQLYMTQYLPGGGSNQFPPQLIGAFQGLSLPLTTVSGTNVDIQGFHPFDWR